MNPVVESEAGAEALLEQLARADPPRRDVSVVLHNYVPRDVGSFLSRMLGAVGHSLALLRAQLTDDTVSYAGVSMEPWRISRPIRIGFRGCVIDAAFLDVFLYRWARDCVIDTLQFTHCDFVGPLPDFAWARRPTVQVHCLEVEECDVMLTRCAGMLARTMPLRALRIDPVPQGFVDWLPDIPTEHLRSLELRETDYRGAGMAAVTDLIRRARGLVELTLEIDLNVPAEGLDALASAIGAHRLERLHVGASIPFSRPMFQAAVAPQTSLVKLVIFSEDSGAADDMARYALQHNPWLEILSIRSRGAWDFHARISQPLEEALLLHDHIMVLGISDSALSARMQSHLQSNADNKVRGSWLDHVVDMPALIPVLVTGALRDVVCELLGHDETVERQTARAIAQSVRAREAAELVNQPTYYSLLGEEFASAVAAAAPSAAEPVLVPYAVSVVPPDVFAGAVRVHAIRSRDQGALANLLRAPVDAAGAEILVTDQGLPDELARRVRDLRPDVMIAGAAGLRAEIVERHARAPPPRVPLRDLLYLMAVVHAGARLLSAADLAAIRDEFGPAAQLPPNPYVYPVTGGTIAQMHAALDAARDVFARPAILARVLGAGRRIPTTWANTGVLPIQAIARIFRHVVDSDDIAYDDVTRVLTVFDVIFPVDGARAVFPRFRGAPRALYRVLAYLAGAPRVHFLSQDSTGSITFDVDGERMTAQFAGHAVVVDGATDAARRMAYLIGVAVDL